MSTVRQKAGQGADRDKDFYLEEKNLNKNWSISILGNGGSFETFPSHLFLSSPPILARKRF